MMELKHLQKIYNRGSANRIHAVNDVDMQLPDHGMVAIFGRSGCGKTTLLNCIGGLDLANSGEVTLDGEVLTPDATEARNRHVGYIFQNYNLSKNLTVFENVAVSLRLCGVEDEAQIERRVCAALESVDMLKYRKRLPDALSGGQQQRVAIARAIVKNPKLILADEPTGNLDEQNTVLVMDLLKEISREHLVLLVTHEAELVDLYCDRVVEMSDGSVTEVRENTHTAGYVGKTGTEIYLGDLSAECEAFGDMTVEYFGEMEEKPAKLRLVSYGGTLYIKADTALKVRLLDHTTEAMVHEGKFKEQARREIKELSPVLREPLAQTGRAGRMYDLSTAVKTGFRANFKGVRRGKKLLIAALVCFPLIIVLVLSAFGTVFRSVRNVSRDYNANTVFLSASSASYEEALQQVEAGLSDHVFLAPYGPYPNIKQDFYFCIGNFETFADEYSSYFMASGIMLPRHTIPQTEVLCGRTTVEGEGEMVISRGFADLLLEACGVNYIKDYEDLLYTMGKCGTWSSGVEGQIVVGITDEAESVVYLHDYVYTQNLLEKYHYCDRDYVTDVAHAGIALEPLERGELYCMQTALADRDVQAGDRVTVLGQKFTVKAVLDPAQYYDTDGFISSVVREYGEDIFRDMSAFSLWYYGADLTEYSEWLAYYGNASRDWESDLEDLRRSYNDVYERELGEFLKGTGITVPGIVFHSEDLLKLTAMQGKSLEKQVFNALYTMKTEESYYAFHSEAPKVLEQTLTAAYGAGAVVTPDEMHEFYAAMYTEELVFSLTIIIGMVAMMSLCLYFIMRSSLMSDIKEVGICRAIGVSRRNLIFRYFVETLVLYVLTVLLGFLVASGALFWLTSLHGVVSQILYYPAWMALVTLSGLFGVSVLCGLAPILSLLRLTPAQILSKYDI